MPAVTPLVPDEQPASPARASPAAGQATVPAAGRQGHVRGRPEGIPGRHVSGSDQGLHIPEQAVSAPAQAAAGQSRPAGGGPAVTPPSAARLLADSLLADSQVLTAAGPSPGARRIIRQGARSGRLTHLELIPASAGRRAAWPGWVPAELTEALGKAGVPAPWAHQAAAADLAHSGRNVIISTGTASGKSVGYLLPALTGVLAGSTTLYIAPTKALAADQLRVVRSLGLRGVRAAVIDGDTPAAERSWARAHASYLLTTPDMLHHMLLPRHSRWDGFLRRLQYVIVDECHGYRGVFGSHVAHVLRRLRRVAAHHAAAGRPAAGRTATAAGPVFILASATISEPGRCARLLTGLDAEAVTESAAPRGPLTFCLWEPPLTTLRGEAGAPVRRTATAEAAGLLADLVMQDVPALAFTRSRRGAEAVAMGARRALAEAGAASLAPRVAAYRSGYLRQDRRDLEDALRAGTITGLATTTALELGVNISGLDAVLIAGWPGTRAALWQQAGRAGRDGRGAVAILIARDDPLDTYLVHHPEAILHQPVEATVLDPGNPYVLAPHLCSAAAELPLTQADIELFGPGAAAVADRLTQRGMLRPRGHWRYWTRQGRAAAASLRGTGGQPVRIVEEATGRLVGTVDEPSAHVLAHTGAVYPHQGEMYLVTRLDLAEGVALVEARDPGYATSARELTRIEVTAEQRRVAWGAAQVHFGDVQVTRQVTSNVRRQLDSGQQAGQTPLDLPARTLRTRAVWWTISADQRAGLAGRGVDLAGAAHAAEHASIGLLPLVAACDRSDVGGVSADLHPATGQLTVFVYDGHDGGAGFAERGFRAAGDWLRATARAIESCECGAGCPSCIQSPKCGNGNEPLSKRGAVRLLECLLEGERTVSPPQR
jgi:DEAD/DEAH box helicase domain-containing protein